VVLHAENLGDRKATERLFNRTQPPFTGAHRGALAARAMRSEVSLGERRFDGHRDHRPAGGSATSDPVLEQGSQLRRHHHGAVQGRDRLREVAPRHELAAARAGLARPPPALPERDEAQHQESVASVEEGGVGARGELLADRPGRATMVDPGLF
jgi:hypothetical protein